jgi:hypothetical protein
VLIYHATCREHNEAKENFEAVVAKGERVKQMSEFLKAKLKEKLSELCQLNYSFLGGLK